MKKTITIQIADPAGNVTIFVRDPFPQSQYHEIATQLLNRCNLNAEQVCFIEAPDRMRMCGGEFCGNASRSFGLMRALELGRQGTVPIEVQVSGMTAPAQVKADTENRTAEINMPLPRSISPYASAVQPAASGWLVDMDGIVHLVLPGLSGDKALFEALRQEYYTHASPPAFGVMFLDESTHSMLPYVYVRDVNTTYLEGSCGSGSTAAAAVMALEKADGHHLWNITQPAGTLSVSATKKGGNLLATSLDGPVILYTPREIEIVL